MFFLFLFSVMPFASLVGRVGESVPRVLINREPVGPFAQEPQQHRDILMLGDCGNCTFVFCVL
jgi:hypothetical protein